MQFKFTYLEPLGISNYLPFHANLATIFLTEIKLRQVGLRQRGELCIVGGTSPPTDMCTRADSWAQLFLVFFFPAPGLEGVD